MQWWKNRILLGFAALIPRGVARVGETRGPVEECRPPLKSQSSLGFGEEGGGDKNAKFFQYEAVNFDYLPSSYL